jgi:hypothetical protein
MEIKIESGQLQTSKTSGKQYTNCKLGDGSFMNIWGDQTEHIGKRININEPTVFHNTKWTSIDKSKPEPKSEPQKHNGISKQDYLNFMEEVWSRVMKLEPDKSEGIEKLWSCADARAALVNTAMIAFTNGKIINEADEPPDEEEPY